jgi:hypothetical protein
MKYRVNHLMGLTTACGRVLSNLPVCLLDQVDCQLHSGRVLAVVQKIALTIRQICLTM